MEREAITHKLTTADAVALLSRAPRGVEFALHLRFDCPVEGNDELVYRGAGSSYTTVSRKEALRIASVLLHPNLEASGARIRVTVRAMTSHLGGTSTTYWIG